MKSAHPSALFGLILVALQFALIALMLWPPIIPSAYALLPLAAGAALGCWTLIHNRIGNFNIRPEPKQTGQLVTSGPYRFIRHPMYTAVLLTMLSFAFSGNDPFKIAYWLMLLTVLWLKSLLEEIMLEQKFPKYDSYRKMAGRFLPQLFHR